MKQKKSLFVIITIIVSLFFGCSPNDRPAGFPKIYPCTISIIQDGKPLPGCTVSLMPVDSANTWSSGGTTNESGVVQLRTHGRFVGVPQGEFKVTVTKHLTEGEDPGPFPLGANPEEVAEYNRRLATNPLKLFEVVDKPYWSAETTPISIHVEPKGSNQFTLDVGASVRLQPPGPPSR